MTQQCYANANVVAMFFLPSSSPLFAVDGANAGVCEDPSRSSPDGPAMARFSRTGLQSQRLLSGRLSLKISPKRILTAL